MRFELVGKAIRNEWRGRRESMEKLVEVELGEIRREHVGEGRENERRVIMKSVVK